MDKRTYRTKKCIKNKKGILGQQPNAVPMSQDLHESNAEIETIAPPEPPKPAKEWVFTFESLAQKSLSYFFMNEGDNQAEEIENNKI